MSWSVPLLVIENLTVTLSYDFGSIQSISSISKINMTDIAKIDLNLLVSLEALLEEKSVSLAAKRLSVGQPAMSYNLARLRTLLADDLLVRTARGMSPTPKATSMEKDVRDVLRRVRSLLDREVHFDPATAEITFRLGVTDSVEAILVPVMLAMLREQAPGISLKLFPIGRLDVSASLDAATFDLAVGVFADGRNYHKRRVIYDEGFHTIYNPGLVDMQGPVTVANYARWPMLAVEGSGADPVQIELERLGIAPCIAIRTPHLLTVPFILSRVPLIATVHTQVAALFVTSFGLAMRPVPQEFSLASAKLMMMWHSASDNVPVNRWMRSLIATALANTRAKKQNL
ncbi:LysR family transcriptional regulator [Agrobacterium tumefaciens CCNWGS0286]|uniref:LysR family transcriptional regulator n=1 Tax=Agrobacterium tumefaciens TaxID=358 RepID=UPI0002334687|nr:LysR family transcriptional regulator [Agrobacterium tumefaciens]EHH03578.1 LysR family transcriptional regulator [Agrobacterium tumefaciens CCNWGS0286]